MDVRNKVDARISLSELEHIAGHSNLEQVQPG